MEILCLQLHISTHAFESHSLWVNVVDIKHALQSLECSEVVIWVQQKNRLYWSFVYICLSVCIISTAYTTLYHYVSEDTYINMQWKWRSFTSSMFSCFGLTKAISISVVAYIRTLNYTYSMTRFLVYSSLLVTVIHIYTHLLFFYVWEDPCANHLFHDNTVFVRMCWKKGHLIFIVVYLLN